MIRLRLYEQAQDLIILQNMLALVLVDGSDFIKRQGWKALSKACQDYFLDWERPGDTAFIAETQDLEPLGALWMRRPLTAGTPFVALACLPSHRGMGIGHNLIFASQRWAIEAGHDLSLSVHAKNPAIRLYRRCGFREVGWTEESSTGLMIRMICSLPAKGQHRAKQFDI